MAIGFRNCFVFAALFAALPWASEGANVLGVLTSHSTSHMIIHMSYIKLLVERGHNVTVITTIPIDKNLRVNHIFIPPSEQLSRDMDEIKANLVKPNGALDLLTKIPKAFSVFVESSREAVLDPRVQDLMYNKGNKFDLMIMGYFMNDFELGLAAKLNCPVAISWMGASNSWVDKFVGNPPEVSYVPASAMFPGGDSRSFFGRLKNFILLISSRLFSLLVDIQIGGTYRELFPAPEFPPLSELNKKVSLLLLNSHFSEGGIRPLVPAAVNVGGIQIKDKPDPLPEHLKAIVDSATEHGVIYVSFGSNVDSKNINKKFVENLYKVFSSLKQTVLWKWDGEEKPGNAPNIHFEKWLPQDDLLAHPNVKLFVTHAGKGSVAESQYHGVPMVAIPMFAEQPTNAQQLVEAGFGVQIDHVTMTADSLKSAVLEVLQNPKYKERVMGFSTLYRDRPMSARETAIYWMEYVIRHKGAYHMQSPLVHLNGLQYLSLDVLAFLLVVTYVAFLILRWSVKLVSKLIRGMLCSRKQKVKRQ